MPVGRIWNSNWIQKTHASRTHSTNPVHFAEKCEIHTKQTQSIILYIATINFRLCPKMHIKSFLCAIVKRIRNHLYRTIICVAPNWFIQTIVHCIHLNWVLRVRWLVDCFVILLPFLAAAQMCSPTSLMFDKHIHTSSVLFLSFVSNSLCVCVCVCMAIVWFFFVSKCSIQFCVKCVPCIVWAIICLALVVSTHWEQTIQTYGFHSVRVCVCVFWCFVITHCHVGLE